MFTENKITCADMMSWVLFRLDLYQQFLSTLDVALSHEGSQAAHGNLCKEPLIL